MIKMQPMIIAFLTVCVLGFQSTAAVEESDLYLDNVFEDLMVKDGDLHEKVENFKEDLKNIKDDDKLAALVPDLLKYADEFNKIVEDDENELPAVFKSLDDDNDGEMVTELRKIDDVAGEFLTFLQKSLPTLLEVFYDGKLKFVQDDIQKELSGMQEILRHEKEEMPAILSSLKLGNEMNIKEYMGNVDAVMTPIAKENMKDLPKLFEALGLPQVE